ncbi:hypothetical protein ACFE04_025685 [Oxalis oulophora]
MELGNEQEMNSSENIHVSAVSLPRDDDISDPMLKHDRKSSSNFQCLANVDKLVTSLDDTAGSTTISKASSKGLDCSSSLEPKNFWESPKFQITDKRENENGQLAAAEVNDSDSSNCRNSLVECVFPIHLKFQDVNYKIPIKSVSRSGANEHILNRITGSVRPGEVLALMGPSGGGKTTLLNILSGRIKLNSGTITYNDQRYSTSLKRRIGFVMQDDVAFPHLTVKETLTFAALLRLPNTLTKQQKEERAMDIITELGLQRCQNSIVGGAAVRGISGGERKRVCIGSEILLNPSLLFLDEPTSGLDSTTALRIVQMLKNIGEAGKTVVTTIHQPSSRMFSKFDKLILLGKGSSLYFGKASEAMLYFSSIGCCPLIAMNPAEFLIDLANGNMNDKSVPPELEDRFMLSEKKRLEMREDGLSSVDVHEYLIEAYEFKLEKWKTGKILESIDVVKDYRSTFSESKVNWWQQFSILFKRNLKERRYVYLNPLSVIQVISTAIIIGFLWWRSDTSTPKRLHDQAGVLFFISVFWVFFPLFTAVFTFPQERAMLAKERSVDMYRLSAYFAARCISDLPFDLILPIVFILIVYFMAGLKLSFTAFSLTVLTLFLCILASQGLGLAIGSALMDVKKATTFATVIIMAFMLAGGFFIEKVPSFMLWLRYISCNYHTYKLLLSIQYDCSDTKFVSVPCESSFIKGSLRLNRVGTNVGVISGMIIGYRLLAYFFLRRMKLRTDK